MDRLVAFIVDESKWLAASMGFALLAVAVLFIRHRRSNLPRRRVVAAAMNLFLGLTIGVMALGHLLAVTTKLVLGTLSGSLLAFYAIGLALAVPSGWLAVHARWVLVAPDSQRRRTVIVNSWLALTLLTLGVHNLPLAAPAFVNIAYSLHSRRAVGWALVSMAVVVNLGLFIGSLVFLASGQTFEQFRGIE